jgi:hypothetical protein
MMRFVTLCLASSVSIGIAASHLRSYVHMQPKQVAATLMKVQNEWKAQARIATECASPDEISDDFPACKEALTAFHHSCIKVASVVMLSSSNSDDAKEYMTDVCTQSELSSWHKSKCNVFGAAITSKMSANAADNRQNYFKHAEKACTSVWSAFEQEAQSLRHVEVKQLLSKPAADPFEKKAVQDAKKTHQISLDDKPAANQVHMKQKAYIGKMSESKVVAPNEVSIEKAEQKVKAKSQDSNVDHVASNAEKDAKQYTKKVQQLSVDKEAVKQNNGEPMVSKNEQSDTEAIHTKKASHKDMQNHVEKASHEAKNPVWEELEIVVAPLPERGATSMAAAAITGGKDKMISQFAPKAAQSKESKPLKNSEDQNKDVALLQTARSKAPVDTLAKEMTHDLELNLNRIAPFGKEDTAKELQDHASKTQDTLVDAVENAEVAEIKRAVFRALTRLRAATIKEFDTIARLETQAIDAYNDAHHFRAENPLAHLHEDEAPVSTDKLKSFH